MGPAEIGTLHLLDDSEHANMARMDLVFRVFGYPIKWVCKCRYPIGVSPGQPRGDNVQVCSFCLKFTYSHRA